MTALHLRKHTAQLLKLTAVAIETSKLPTKEQLKDKISEYRIRTAALIMPKECQLYINN